MPKDSNDLINFVQDLVKKNLAGKDGSTFSPLFEGKIRDELLNPLFRRINEAINTTQIKTQDIDLGSIVKDAVGKINISDDTVKAVNVAFSDKFSSIVDSINSIDSSTFKNTILQDITAKFDKSIKDISVLKADINLAEINPFKSDENTSQKYKSIINKIVTQLESNLDKLQIDSAGISQDTIFKALFNDTSSNSDKVTRQYRELASSTLRKLSAYVDILNIDSTSSISQQSILDILFSNTDINAGIFVRSNFNSLRSNVLRKLGDVINDKAFDFKIGDKSLDQIDLLNMLFSGNTPEYSGLLSLTNSQRAFNTLRSDVLNRLSAATPQRFEISNDPITPSKLLNILFSSNTPEYSSFLGVGGSAVAFNRLRSRVLKQIEESTDNIRIDNNKTLSQKDIIDVLFNQTPEMGLLSRYTLWDVRTNILRKIERSFKVEDESITKKDILEILFNSAASTAFDLGALSKKITDLVDTTTPKEADDITTPGREIATREGDEVFTRNTFNISEESITSLIDKFKDTLADADILTNKRQSELNKELVKLLTIIADKETSTTKTLGETVGESIRRVAETAIGVGGATAGSWLLSKFPKAAQMLSKVPGLSKLIPAAATTAAEVAPIAGEAGVVVSGLSKASKVGKYLKVGGGLLGGLSLYSGYKEGEEADKLKEEGQETASKWKRAASWLDYISGASALGAAGTAVTGVGLPAAGVLGITSAATGLLSIGADWMADKSKSRPSKELSNISDLSQLPNFAKDENLLKIKSQERIDFSTLTNFLTPSFNTLYASMNRIDAHLFNIHTAIISNNTNDRSITPIPMTPTTRSVNTPPIPVTRTDVMDFRRAVKEGVL